jgi:hypothetical protein
MRYQQVDLKLAPADIEYECGHGPCAAKPGDESVPKWNAAKSRNCLPLAYQSRSLCNNCTVAISHAQYRLIGAARMPTEMQSARLADVKPNGLVILQADTLQLLQNYAEKCPSVFKLLCSGQEV